MATTSFIHVVSKIDNSKHTVYEFTFDPSASPLAASSIRVQTKLISLTSNNLSYARGGEQLHWWDTYPVPLSSPAPYNNQQEWGIVPAWGYARVLESTIHDIAPGSLLYGMWPTSAHAVDLQLKPQPGAPGHWIETSPHRSALMTVYSNYEQITAPLDVPTMELRTLCKPQHAAPHLLNKTTFSREHKVHPLGFGGPWSDAEASLTNAVIISLSASSKTGRCFHWELARNRAVQEDGPLALLQVTSVPASLSAFESPLPVRGVSYGDLDAGLNWAAEFQPSRSIVIDFGAPDAVLQATAESLKKRDIEVQILAVGAEAKIYTPEELMAKLEMPLAKVQVNASGLRDQDIAAKGFVESNRELDEARERCIADGTFSYMTIKPVQGVKGASGLEGVWSDLCARKVDPTVGIVVHVSD